MACSEYGLLLSKWIDNELTEHERELVLGHLGECADCRAELSILQSNDSLITNSLADEEFSHSVVQAVLQRSGEEDRGELIELSTESPMGRLLRLPTTWITAGASVAAAVLLVVTMMGSSERAALSKQVDELNSQLKARETSTVEFSEALARKEQEINQLQAEKNHLRGQVINLLASQNAAPQQDTERKLGNVPSIDDNQETVSAGIEPTFDAWRADESGVVLSFVPGTRDDIKAWRLERRAEFETNFKPMATFEVSQEVFLDTNVDYNQTYHYRVVCLDRDEEPVEEANFNTSITTGSKIQLLAEAERGSQFTRISWDMQGTDLPFTYNVYRKSLDALEERQLNASPLSGTSFTDSNLEPMNVYWYKIVAVDENGPKWSSPMIRVDVGGFAVRFLGSIPGTEQALIEVQTMDAGEIFTETFKVKLGESVGRRTFKLLKGQVTGRYIHFNTGYTLEKMESLAGGPTRVILTDGGAETIKLKTGARSIIRENR